MSTKTLGVRPTRCWLLAACFSLLGLVIEWGRVALLGVSGWKFPHSTVCGIRQRSRGSGECLFHEKVLFCLYKR